MPSCFFTTQVDGRTEGRRILGRRRRAALLQGVLAEEEGRAGHGARAPPHRSATTVKMGRATRASSSLHRSVWRPRFKGAEGIGTVYGLISI